MTKNDLIAIARAAAVNAGVDPALVCAVCHHESAGWKQYATRYEPGFYRRYIEPMKDVQVFGAVSQDTERQGRAFSYGLMQIMGQVARELGFQGEFLAELTDPLTNVTYGIKRLKKALDKKNGNVREALLDYNGGGIPEYPDLVMAHYNEYTAVVE